MNKKKYTILKQIRLDNNISQRYMAATTGIAVQTLRNWENRLCAPNLSNIVKIARFLEDNNIPMPWQAIIEDYVK